MAKIKMGMVVTDARGKLGGQVFSKNRSGAYVRTKVTPVNPQTSFQMASRQLLGSLSSGWSGLTDEQRKQWNDAVNDWQRTDVFGDLRKPTGKNLFTELNKNLLQSGTGTLMTIPPEKQEIPIISLASPYFDTTVPEFSVGFGIVPAKTIAQIMATPPLSAGTSFIKDRLRVIGYVSAGAMVDTANAEMYIAKFGMPPAGSNVHVAVKLIGTNGQAGVQVSAKVDVTD